MALNTIKMNMSLINSLLNKFSINDILSYKIVISASYIWFNHLKTFSNRLDSVQLIELHT